ncbi:MAG: amino acid dehydrogenase [Saprospiraceae bacterium]|jgi:glutamate dehydrogenase/leucine dehydrogenase|nr:amino acid dehydrogenase [Saprospiraceae bacterium]
MDNRLEVYKSKAPEIVFEWQDALTTARGWVVINSLRGGAAGGGTRMRKGLTKDEVVSLAKVMEIKFSVSGPAIGGAKSGIDFDPNDPRKDEVLQRWYKAVFPLLKNYYGTGGDLNVDEIRDVVPITEALGLWHPQEGVVNGHFHAGKGERIHVIGQLRFGCAKLVEDPAFAPPGRHRHAVADLITGYGVSESIRHFYDLFRKESLQGKRVVIQGWGNVAAAAGYYLAAHGARITGILDLGGVVLAPDGLDYHQVEELFNSRDGNKLAHPMAIPFNEGKDKFWEMPADIFMPGAASKLVTPEQITRLMDNGLEVVSCGANVPFTDDEVFFGETALMVDQRISLIPDFIANCGMARAFAYLMQPNILVTDHGIFDDVSQTIRKGLLEVQSASPATTEISKRAVGIAMDKLGIVD